MNRLAVIPGIVLAGAMLPGCSAEPLQPSDPNTPCSVAAFGSLAICGESSAPQPTEPTPPADAPTTSPHTKQQEGTEDFESISVLWDGTVQSRIKPADADDFTYKKLGEVSQTTANALHDWEYENRPAFPASAADGDVLFYRDSNFIKHHYDSDTSCWFRVVSDLGLVHHVGENTDLCKTVARAIADADIKEFENYPQYPK